MAFYIRQVTSVSEQPDPDNYTAAYQCVIPDRRNVLSSFKSPAKYVQSEQIQTPTSWYKILTRRKQEKRTLSEETSVPLYKDRNGPI